MQINDERVRQQRLYIDAQLYMYTLDEEKKRKVN